MEVSRKRLIFGTPNGVVFEKFPFPIRYRSEIFTECSANLRLRFVSILFIKAMCLAGYIVILIFAFA